MWYGAVEGLLLADPAARLSAREALALSLFRASHGPEAPRRGSPYRRPFPSPLALCTISDGGQDHPVLYSREVKAHSWSSASSASSSSSRGEEGGSPPRGAQELLRHLLERRARSRRGSAEEGVTLPRIDSSRKPPRSRETRRRDVTG